MNKSKNQSQPKTKTVKVVTNVVRKSTAPRRRRNYANTGIPGPSRAPYIARPIPQRSFGQIRNPRDFKPAMSQCGADYAKALINPFAKLDIMPCIPDLVSTASQKVRAFCRTQFALGTQGAGGIAVWPWNLIMNDIRTFTSLPVNCIVATTNAYPATDMQFINTDFNSSTIPGVTNVTGNSIYSSSQLTTNSERSVRLVSCGLRVAYVGPAFQTNGQIVAWRNPNATNRVNPGSDTLVELAKAQTATWDKNDGNWFMTNYAPIKTTDSDYVPAIGDPLTQLTYNRLMGGIFIQGTPGDQFTAEVVAHFEVIGDNVPTTQSHSAPMDAGMARAAANHSGAPSGRERDQVAAGAAHLVNGLRADTIRDFTALAANTLVRYVMASTPMSQPSSAFNNKVYTSNSFSLSSGSTGKN